VNKILIKIIIYFAQKNLPEFVRLLAKLEYGVSACLSNLAVDASKEGYANLSQMLLAHAQEERNHGKMLATLIDGKQRISLRTNGRWLSLVDVSGRQLANHPDRGRGKLVRLENKVGLFENLDGISQRYLSLRFLLGGKKINQLPWHARIACMACLEEGTFNFYRHFAASNIPDSLKAIVQKIADEEEKHADYFEYVLPQFTAFPHAELDDWRSRIAWASIGLIWDFLRWTKN
jgi:hypothetical protein